MTVSVASQGAVASGTNLNISVPYPASPVAGQLLVLSLMVKPDVRTVTDPGFTTWELHAAGTGGSGVDTGSTKLYTGIKELVGTESGSLALTANQNPNPWIGILLQIAKTAAGVWDIGYAEGGDSTLDSGVDAITAVATSDPGYTAGDLAIVSFSTASDNGVLSNPELIVPGCTVSALTEVASLQTSAGNDASFFIFSATILSGTSTGAPTFQADASDSRISHGPVTFDRYREPASAGPAVSYWDGTTETPVTLQNWDGTTLTTAGSFEIA